MEIKGAPSIRTGGELLGGLIEAPRWHQGPHHIGQSLRRKRLEQNPKAPRLLGRHKLAVGGHHHNRHVRPTAPYGTDQGVPIQLGHAEIRDHEGTRISPFDIQSFTAVVDNRYSETFLLQHGSNRRGHDDLIVDNEGVKGWLNHGNTAFSSFHAL